MTEEVKNLKQQLHKRLTILFMVRINPEVI